VWKKTGSMNKWDCRPEVARHTKSHNVICRHFASDLIRLLCSPQCQRTVDVGQPPMLHGRDDPGLLVAVRPPSTPKYLISSQMLEPSNDPVAAQPQTCAFVPADHLAFPMQTARARMENNLQAKMRKVCNLFLEPNELDSDTRGHGQVETRSHPC
jgi:hypothetical protein